MDGRRSANGEENLDKQNYSKRILLFFFGDITHCKEAGLKNYSVCSVRTGNSAMHCLPFYCHMKVYSHSIK